ncbi:cell division protein FtsW [Paenibacillus castaneae]|uniref:putative lipid II flippase FtsW n=1 Tax=Paenibacillus castaneae TaxID=474957 RepID=UPI000C99A690|nr:putative lipid II flippase FtsW [Paenibacillus castaneae]NIK75413.1 cell division protein FtsW [Paenibacillus castaneae]
MNGIRRGRADFILLFITLLLVGLGLVMIFSSSSAMAIVKYGSPWYFVYKQSVFALVGLFLMVFFMIVPYSFWLKTSPLIMFFSISLLLLSLLLGIHVNGAKRWMVLGGLTFQPSELAKLSVILYLSALISKKGERMRLFKQGLLPILIVLSVIFSLIMMQPDFGSVLIIFFIAVTLIIIGGAAGHQLLLLSLGVIPIFIYLAVSESYRLKRLIAFLNPLDYQSESGYQLIQSFYALGHGGLTGTGIGRSIQKLFYLPEAHTDFIFAVIGEEWGFVGSTLLILIYIFYLWRGCLAALRCPDTHGTLLGMGIVTMISVQAMLNVGAVTGSLPITGVTLPFVSYGGTSLILCMASTGILLSISRNQQRKREQ